MSRARLQALLFRSAFILSSMTGILLGLSAAFWWGTSDFLAARVARSLGALRAILVTQTLGLLGILAVLAWQGSALPAGRIWLTMMAIAAMQTASVFLIYRAFEIGKLSLVAPITSGFAVVTAILALLSGERPARLALAGAALLVLGVLFVTRGQESSAQENGREKSEDDRRSTLRGVPEAILAAFGYGVVFWGLDFVIPEMGAVWPLAILRVVTLIVLSATLLVVRVSLPAPYAWKPLLLPALGVALADTTAWLSFNTGTQRADVAIVTTLASLYSAIAVFFAWMFFRERLHKVQWLGVALILLGILLVGVE